MQQCTTTSKHDALGHDVSRKFGWRLVERHLDGIDDRGKWLFDGASYVASQGDDRLWQSGDKIAATNLGVQFFFEFTRGSECHLDLFCRAIAERQAVLLFHEANDCF